LAPKIPQIVEGLEGHRMTDHPALERQRADALLSSEPGFSQENSLARTTCTKKAQLRHRDIAAVQQCLTG
jgi:hypothetical protein